MNFTVIKAVGVVTLSSFRVRNLQHRLPWTPLPAPCSCLRYCGSQHRKYPVNCWAISVNYCQPVVETALRRTGSQWARLQWHQSWRYRRWNHWQCYSLWPILFESTEYFQKWLCASYTDNKPCCWITNGYVGWRIRTGWRIASNFSGHFAGCCSYPV